MFDNCVLKKKSMDLLNNYGFSLSKNNFKKSQFLSDLANK